MTRPKGENCGAVRISHFGWITLVMLLIPHLMRADEIATNESDAVTICQGYVKAQIEYSHQVHDEQGKLEYAKRIMSSPGKQDGLYWNFSDGGSQSTVPKAFAEAAVEGNQQPRPYHGYYFRVLRAQGPDAPSGNDDYVERGSMIGGFALVAWPAQYSVSGVLTFIVNQDEIVYEKDLGPDTAKLAQAMTSFDPDQSWASIQPSRDSTAADTTPVESTSKYWRQISQKSEKGTTAIGAASESGYYREADAAQETATQLDQALERDVRQQLGTAPSFQNVEIHVNNGVVLLEGPVSSQEARKRAVDLVKVLPGVKRVDEHLTVDAAAVEAATATADTNSNAELNPATSEAALASQIAVAMHDDATLATSPVKVTVKGDVIELTGTVASKQERNKAKEIAKSYAIHQHVVDKLTIAPRDIGKE